MHSITVAQTAGETSTRVIWWKAEPFFVSICRVTAAICSCMFRLN